MVKVIPGRLRPRMAQAYQSLPRSLTRPNPPFQWEVRTPTKPYQDLCSRCETHWCIWIGLPTLTRIRIWLCHRYRIVLPNITSRGVKYTHNDRNSHIPNSDSGPTRIRLIPTEHPQKKVVGDGGAKHRSIDPPTAWYRVCRLGLRLPYRTVAEPALLTPTTS